MTENTPSTAKQALIAAYEMDAQRTARQDKKSALKFQARAERVVAELGLDIDGCTIFPISKTKCNFDWRDLELQATANYDHIMFAVRGTCPHCNKVVWSQSYASARFLGEKIVHFTPHYDHHCKEKHHTDDPMDRLAELLREILELE